MLSVENVARILNVSCPYVVKLVDSGKLGEFDRTEDGHRRIEAGAVEAYVRERKDKSRKALNEFTVTAQELGLYGSTATPDPREK
jgi:excisionase family DNA binding protein